MRLLVLVIAFSFATAQAKDESFYVGGTRVQTDYSSSNQTMDVIEGSTFGVNAGVRTSKHFAFDVTYLPPYDYEEKLCPWLSRNAKLVMSDEVIMVGFRVFFAKFLSARAGYEWRTFKRTVTHRVTGEPILIRGVDYGFTSRPKGYYLGGGLSLPIVKKRVDLFGDFTAHFVSFATGLELGIGLRVYLGWI